MNASTSWRRRRSVFTYTKSGRNNGRYVPRLMFDVILQIVERQCPQPRAVVVEVAEPDVPERELVLGHRSNDLLVVGAGGIVGAAGVEAADDRLREEVERS